jgi:hypothetical protein
MLGMNPRETRAEARRRTTVLHRTTLRAIEEDLDSISGAAALSLVTVLTRESWSESGAPLPTYSRATIPVRFVAGRLT